MDRNVYSWHRRTERHQLIYSPTLSSTISDFLSRNPFKMAKRKKETWPCTAVAFCCMKSNPKMHSNTSFSEMAGEVSGKDPSVMSGFSKSGRFRISPPSCLDPKNLYFNITSLFANQCCDPLFWTTCCFLELNFSY